MAGVKGSAIDAVDLKGDSLTLLHELLDVREECACLGG